jgi:hypothetical protein
MMQVPQELYENEMKKTVTKTVHFLNIPDDILQLLDHSKLRKYATIGYQIVSE